MKNKTLMIILAGMFVLSFVSAALAVPADNNAGGPERLHVLIGFRNVPGLDEQALVRSHGGVIKYSYRFVPGIAASVPQAAIDGLSRNPNVTMVEEDLTVYAIDAELDSAWGVKRIGAGTVHTGGNKGAGVKVAIIDSGIDYNHTDLNANYAGGWDFVNGDAYPMDDNGHGTHVAGIVAAEDNDTGVVGVAPEADLYGLKVLSASGNGSYSDIIAALEWAMSNGIKVTNNSYGSSEYPGLLVELTFDLAADYGIVNVCAAGNYGNTAGTGENMIYPARFASCIAVAATNISDVRAGFSSTGQEMELAAPGSSIRSTYPGGYYVYMSGTSMACPHVAGAAALVIAAGIGDVRTQLQETAIDLGAPGWDPQYGHGLVDAVAAVEGPGQPAPDPIVADFFGGPTSGDAPLEVQFIDLSTGNPTIWSWSFGDGRSSTLQDPLHAYTTSGTYTVSLTATGPGGSDTETKIDYITVINTLPEPPVANFTGSPTSGDAPLAVSFSDLSTGDVTSWTWTFGDGGTSTAQNPSHTYSSAGTYTVSLTATGPGGSDLETKTNYITVTTPPPPASSLHVHSITVTTISASKGLKRGRAEVVIVDNFGDPVSIALVRGSFLEGIDEPGLTEYTNSSGTAEFLTVGTAKGRFHLRFCVDDVTYSGLDYSAVDNIETCDSNY